MDSLNNEYQPNGSRKEVIIRKPGTKYGGKNKIMSRTINSFHNC